MGSSFTPVVFFTVSFVLYSLSAATNLQETKPRFRPHFSPHFLSPPNQNLTTPTRYFEVKKSPFPDHLTTQPPCSYQTLHHNFSYTYTKPPVLANYTLPSNCSFQNFSKIILEFKSTSQGRQFDRIFGVWLNGVELLRSCTAEPRPNGIVWSVEKDVTKYHSILTKNETQILSVYLGNIVDKTYTGVYHVDITFHFYPLEEAFPTSNTSPQADMILPISRNLPLNDGLWFEIMNSYDFKYKEVKIPRNVYRAVLEVYVSFHEDDEFWYGDVNGPFREVVVTLDGEIAGAVWPFPVVYTGGINPLLWRPITAIGSFDLPSYDIEMTPFLGRLLDGKSHKLGFSVTNALNVWFIDANLHLWLDHEKEIVEGKVLKTSGSRSFLEARLNGNFTTKAKRTVISIGLVKSSHGDIVTNATQEFAFENNMFIGKGGNLQIIDQLIQVNDSVHANTWSTESIKSFPFYLNSDSLKHANDTYLEVSNVSMGFNEERSENDTFKSKLENKQEGQGVMEVKGQLVVSGYGSTQQVYNYIGDDQCYFRNISSYNYTILYDTVETVCKKKNTLKLLPLRIESLTKQTLMSERDRETLQNE